MSHPMQERVACSFRHNPHVPKSQCKHDATYRMLLIFEHDKVAPGQKLEALMPWTFCEEHARPDHPGIESEPLFREVCAKFRERHGEYPNGVAIAYLGLDSPELHAAITGQAVSTAIEVEIAKKEDVKAAMGEEAWNRLGFDRKT